MESKPKSGWRDLALGLVIATAILAGVECGLHAFSCDPPENEYVHDRSVDTLVLDLLWKPDPFETPIWAAASQNVRTTTKTRSRKPKRPGASASSASAGR